MQSHRALKILRRQMLKGTDVDGACVVDQDVDLAKAIDDLPNSRSNLSVIEQIALNRQDCATARRKIGLCTGEFFRIPGNESNAATSRANMSRQHESESTRSTGDEDNFFAQGIAGSANDASDYPQNQYKSACKQQKANTHFGILQSSTQVFAASRREEEARPHESVVRRTGSLYLQSTVLPVESGDFTSRLAIDGALL
jgi:hypothetical protein